MALSAIAPQRAHVPEPEEDNESEPHSGRVLTEGRSGGVEVRRPQCMYMVVVALEICELTAARESSDRGDALSCRRGGHGGPDRPEGKGLWRCSEVRLGEGEVRLPWEQGHPGGNPVANLKSISHRYHPILVAFVWELTEETIHLPLGCLQGGSSSMYVVSSEAAAGVHMDAPSCIVESWSKWPGTHSV